jgi:formylglycine-generating enzyme required for sulfatase activity
LSLGLSLLGLLQEKPGGQRYALLVGINLYEHDLLRKLDYAENDVVELAQVLKEHGYEVVLLTARNKEENRQPTRANIEKELKRLARGCRRGDTLVIALAGHGLQFAGEEDCFFCPVYARPYKAEKATLVSLNGVYEELKASFAGVKVLLVDACRDDPAAGRGRGVDGDNAPRPPQGVAALFSCRAGEKAFEHRDLKHGVFFYYVLEGLRGEAANRDKKVTFDGLSGHVRGSVPGKVRELFGQDASQSPNLKADLVGVPPVLLDLSRQQLKPLVAPFGAAEARAARKAWASYLGVKETEKNSLGMDLLLIPPGEFMMGSPDGEKERYQDEVQHKVKLTTAYYLGTTEVTVGQFRDFVEAAKYKTEAETDGKGGNWRGLPAFPERNDQPVVIVTWNDAVKFCEWLSQKESVVYRLPTEAEWEYACRAGTTTPFSFGETISTDQVNYNGRYIYGDGKDGEYRGERTAVGSFAANVFGLHDMHGNVWEWCQDLYGKYRGEAVDPTGPEKGLGRVFRGGSLDTGPLRCRSAFRSGDLPAYRNSNLGFRVARSLSVK